MSRLPNFFILGAARSATTTLYESVRRHPEVYMSPVKEPYFFDLQGRGRGYLGPNDRAGVADFDRYRELFAGARGERVVGEASTHYLASKRAPEGIHDCIPDAKLLAVLRNPIDRALSHWALHVSEGVEPLSFEAALDAEPERARAGWSPGWSYAGGGLYGEQLERYFALFASEQIRVVIYDDLDRDYAGQLRELWRFLGVDPSFQPPLRRRYNPAGLPLSPLLQRVLVHDDHPVRRLARPLMRVVSADARDHLHARVQRRVVMTPSMPDHVRARLVDLYRADLARCERLIGRDLSAWLASE